MALGALCLAVLGTTGCNSDGSGSDNAGDGVTEVVQSYVASLVDGDGERYCALLTAEHQQRIIEEARDQVEGPLPQEARICSFYTGGLGASFYSELDGLRTGLTVRENKAAANVDWLRPGGQVAFSKRVELVKRDGTWLISRTTG